MSDLTDSKFYPSVERIWLCIRLNNAGVYCDITLKIMIMLQNTKIIFSDEAHFHLGGYVNKQNCRIWATENPHAYIEKPTHPKRVSVWYGFCSRGIIGPFFFENEQGEEVTVNGDRYRTMLNEFLFTKTEEENISTFGFKRKVLHATQPAKATLDVLRPVFGDRIISCRATTYIHIYT